MARVLTLTSGEEQEMAVATVEDGESLLERSRAEIRALWLLLKAGTIKRAELNEKMTELLDKLMVEHNDIYQLLEPELTALRIQTLGDKTLRDYD